MDTKSPHNSLFEKIKQKRQHNPNAQRGVMVTLTSELVAYSMLLAGEVTLSKTVSWSRYTVKSS